MLLSERYKFIKIDIPKTGTASFRRNWRQFSDIIGSPFRSVNGFYQHDTASTVKTILAKKNKNWDDYFSFTIIRNPWDRYVSFLYYYIYQAKDYEDTIKNVENIEEVWSEAKIIQAKIWYEKFKNFDMNDQANISWFLKYIILQRDSQTEYLLDEHNNNIINYVGKFENLESEYKFLVNKLNIQGAPNNLLNLNKHNINKLENKKIYTQELIDLVIEKDNFIIKKYGYQFQ